MSTNVDSATYHYTTSYRVYSIANTFEWSVPAKVDTSLRKSGVKSCNVHNVLWQGLLLAHKKYSEISNTTLAHSLYCKNRNQRFHWVTRNHNKVHFATNMLPKLGLLCIFLGFWIEALSGNWVLVSLGHSSFVHKAFQGCLGTPSESRCQQRVKSDPLTATTNGLILIHLVYSGLASAITPAFRFCFSR